jgi:hypothetical protein
MCVPTSSPDNIIHDGDDSNMTARTADLYDFIQRWCMYFRKYGGDSNMTARTADLYDFIQRWCKYFRKYGGDSNMTAGNV